MEHGCCPSLLCSLPSLLLLAQLPMWNSADKFLVIGPSDPIVAELGGDAILPCSLVPAMNAEDMELRWFRTKFSEAVLIYRNRQEQHKEQMPQYAGRTSLVRDLLTQGQAAVHIQKVQASDSGMYVCFFKTRSYYEEAILELQVADELQADLGWRKAAYLVDWRKERFQAWSVTLNPDSAHGNIAISPEKTSVSWKYTGVGLDEDCSVLGLEGITSGRCYWEVEIRSGYFGNWAVGVCREHVTRIGRYTESPDKGFWVVGWFFNRYLAWTKPQKTLFLRQGPRRVGIFLDYDEGDVSFYNMTDGSHIFSFPKAFFSGTLFPYFKIDLDVSLSICSTEGGHKGLPVPLSKSPSLGGSVWAPGEGLSSDSGVDGAPPGVESPCCPEPHRGPHCPDSSVRLLLGLQAPGTKPLGQVLMAQELSHLVVMRTAGSCLCSNSRRCKFIAL